MSPRTIAASVVRSAPPLAETEPIESAVRRILASGLPALPVTDRSGCLAGIFGEREFMAALFPRYVLELRFAGFVPDTVDAAIEKRRACRLEPVGDHMSRDHVDVPPDASDLQVAETFLHHPVLLVPVCERRRVTGVILRRDFFAALADRLLAD
jgi:CBS-domain-containing membrane protein